VVKDISIGIRQACPTIAMWEPAACHGCIGREWSRCRSSLYLSMLTNFTSMTRNASHPTLISCKCLTMLNPIKGKCAQVFGTRLLVSYSQCLGSRFLHYSLTSPATPHQSTKGKLNRSTDYIKSKACRVGNTTST